jgi:hypothetical protein
MSGAGGVQHINMRRNGASETVALSGCKEGWMGLQTPETERTQIPEPEPLEIPVPEPSEEPDPVGATH